MANYTVTDAEIESTREHLLEDCLNVNRMIEHKRSATGWVPDWLSREAELNRRISRLLIALDERKIN